MQLMIDVTVETPEALDIAVNFLMQHAALKRAGTLPAYTGIVPTGAEGFTGTTHVPDVVPVPPPPPSNVVPFPPPVPPANTATAPGIFTPSPTSASVVVPPAPPTAVATAILPSAPVVPPATPVVPAAIEYDANGVPHDERIHGKNKKKDGSWKLRKNIDQAIVTQVIQELHATGRMRPAGQILGMIPAPPSSPAAPSAEVTAPTFPAGTVPVPPVASGTPGVPMPPQFDGGVSVPAMPLPPPPTDGSVFVPPPPPVMIPSVPPPPPVSLQPSAVSVPPPPHVGVSNSGHTGVVSDFRSLVMKITEAQKAGRLPPDKVLSLVQQVGAPSLQMLHSMPHLIPSLDALLDAHLLTV